MTFAPFECQKRIFEILNANVALANKVFDRVPDKQAFPFVVIGEAQWNDRGSHTTEGYTGVLTIHVWDRQEGRKTVLETQAIIDGLLHKVDPNLNGWIDISFRRDFSEVITDPDNITHHGIQRFIILTGGNQNA